MQYVYSSKEDSEVVLVFECNYAGLKKLIIFFLNRKVTHLPSEMPRVISSIYSTVKSIFNFSYFDPDLLQSD
jgi:hypothetical protein